MTGKVLKKREGFEGQRLIVLPKKIITNFLTRDAITRPLYITDIGYYPKARHHHVERPNGVGQFIIIYCVEGSGWIETARKRTEIAPSHFAIIPAHTAHRYAAHEEDPWSIYWIHFRGQLGESILKLIQEHIKTNKSLLRFDENRIRLFEDIIRNLEKGYSGDNLRYVSMIFYHFLSSLLYEDKFSFTGNRSDTDTLARTIEYMQQKIDTVITLEELARFANLSVSHFSAVFRKKTGYAPMEYFNHLKIQKACQLLLFTDDSVKKIALDLGIDDPYYFSRMFSKLMGMSPKEYRGKTIS